MVAPQQAAEREFILPVAPWYSNFFFTNLFGIAPAAPQRGSIKVLTSREVWQTSD
jgi:hypothetical protein